MLEKARIRTAPVIDLSYECYKFFRCKLGGADVALENRLTRSWAVRDRIHGAANTTRLRRQSDRMNGRMSVIGP